MTFGLKTTTALTIIAMLSSGCAVAKGAGKVAALPVKGVYYTGKYAGKGVIGTAKVAGKGVYYTGKGVYKTGETVVRVTDAALDTTVKVLTITTLVVDLSGKTVALTKTVTRADLDAHIAAAKAAANVVEVIVDIAR